MTRNGLLGQRRTHWSNQNCQKEEWNEWEEKALVKGVSQKCRRRRRSRSLTKARRNLKKVPPLPSESFQGRSQPVKLTPAATAVEKKSSMVKEEPDWSEESEAFKKGKKQTVTGLQQPELDSKVRDGPGGSIQVPSYSSDVASLASKTTDRACGL